MSEQNEAFIRRWFEEVWNKKNEAAIDEMLDDKVVAFGLADGQGNPVNDKVSFKAIWRQFTEVYPDLRIEVEEAMAVGDRAMARCKVTGTHRGVGFGFAGTGAPVEFTGMLMAEIKDGKITKAWNEFNFMDMFQQLSAVALVDPHNSNEALVRRWFEEVWNNGREEAIHEMMHTECVTHGITDGQGNEMQGTEGFSQHFRAFTGAFSDLKVEVEDVVVQGDKIVARCTVTGKHAGDGIGLPATGKDVRITGMVMSRIVDGKFVEGWNEFNLLSMYQQLDALPQQMG